MDTFLAKSIEFGVIFLFGCIGEILTEKSGHLNLGIPGIMCAGAAGGCLGVKIAVVGSANPVGFLVVLSAIFFACLFAGALGLIYAFLTVSFRANQNVTGLAITIFGVGFTSFFINSVVLTDETSSTLLSMAGGKFFNAYLPLFDKMGWFGKIFFAHGPLVYLAIIIALVSAYMLKRTRIGLNLRAVGENPATADAAGINVTAYKYVFILVGSAIAGLGGLCYVMGYMNGIVGAGVDSVVEGIGWLSIALVIFTLWKPDFAILGSIVFGALYIFPNYLSVFFQNVTFDFATKQLFKIVPYVVTILVLIFTSIRGKKENQAPASLGLSYFREER